MSTEFLADAQERLVTILRASGISAQVAGMVAAEWSASVEADWGGDRPYIGKGAHTKRTTSQRDAAIYREWEAGERVRAIARKYGISHTQVRRVIAQSVAP